MGMQKCLGLSVTGMMPCDLAARRRGRVIGWGRELSVCADHRTRRYNDTWLL